ncbi:MULTISPECIES: DUF1080 domain-containing protein [unclassified Spirosoma]|uniref:3-keto-disaccharide hydrolase n=1 Tax=unclassified Spirosoma TaxID=2621999 RepID=UPI00095F737D|nr:MULTISPECIES: DUF1080 domain-containing protein [unclassified Spirosoma]MBN8826344.1 DUF1080 domain-containing protein [Spirosoma sp.]OJW76139.1 MAG: hypothetical protein BGO59_03155 [Spirosoma sp. 48-14]
MKSPISLPVIFLCFVTSVGVAQKAPTPIFNANHKNEWYTFLSESGKNHDPHAVFTFEGDVIHVSGEEFGYIATNKEYSNFHLRVEFRWGEKKYPPRVNDKRDAGILYHADFYNGDKVWPRCLEYQIQEGDCGDVWMVDSVMVMHRGKQTTPMNWIRGQKELNNEKPNGEWNTAEVIVNKGKFIHMLNGKKVNEGELINTQKGHILLQSEGAEVFYRNASIREFTDKPR